MRRLTRTVTTVSLAAFLSLTGVHSNAAQPTVKILGVMKQKDKWQVGTVDNQGDKYCAMVGSFDQASVLAFARNPAGFGSLAIEFQDDIFTKDKDYEVQLAVDTGIPMTFTGVASNARSLVIQIGEDSAVYNALSTSKTLRFSSSAIDAKFALSKFSSGYKELVSCATALMPIDPAVPQMSAVKVGDVETVNMADDFLDQAVAEEAQPENALETAVTVAAADGENGDMAAAGAPEKEKKSFFGKFFSKFKGREEPAVSEPSTHIAAVNDTFAEEVEKPLAAQDESSVPLPLRKPAQEKKTVAVKTETTDVQSGTDTANTVMAKDVERKLLASTNTDHVATDVTSETSGLSARDMEARQTAELQKAIFAKENEIAVLAAERAQAARDEFAAAELQQEIFKRKADEVLVERDLLKQQVEKDIATAADTEAKTDVSANPVSDASVPALNSQALLQQKNDALEKLEAEKAASNKALVAKLADMQAKFDAEKAALEADRDSLKQKLSAAQDVANTVLPEKTAELKAGQQRVQVLERKLGSTEAARLELMQILSDMEVQNQKLQAALQQKEKELQDTSADAKAIQKQKKEMAALQARLTERSMQSAALEETLTAEKVKASADLAAVVDEKDTALDTMEARLSEAEAAHKLAAERAAKLEEARLEAEKRVAALEETLAEAKVTAEAEMAAVAAAAASKAAAETEAKMKADMAASMKAAASAVVEEALKVQQAELKKEVERQKKEEILAAGATVASPERIEVRIGADMQKSQNPVSKSALEPAVKERQDAAQVKPVMERFPGTDVALTVSKIEPAVGDVETKTYQTPALQAHTKGAAEGAAVKAAAPVSPNRAAAFLDGIMSYHTQSGKTADKAKPVETKKAALSPVVEEEPLVPAAAAPQSAAAKPATRALMPLADMPVVKDMPAISLETLLTRAGRQDAVFRQGNSPDMQEWSIGSINGMYEVMPAHGTFEAQASQYISRYEADCPQKLHVQMGAPVQTSAGMVSLGTMNCSMPGNAYGTSMIFVKKGAAFGALLHAGQAQEFAQVKSLGDNVYYALAHSGGVAMDQAATPVVEQQPVLRFNLKAQEPEDEFKTVIIQ